MQDDGVMFVGAWVGMSGGLCVSPLFFLCTGFTCTKSRVNICYGKYAPFFQWECVSFKMWALYTHKEDIKHTHWGSRKSTHWGEIYVPGVWAVVLFFSQWDGWLFLGKVFWDTPGKKRRKKLRRMWINFKEIARGRLCHRQRHTVAQPSCLWAKLNRKLCSNSPHSHNSPKCSDYFSWCTVEKLYFLVSFPPDQRFKC